MPFFIEHKCIKPLKQFLPSYRYKHCQILVKWLDHITILSFYQIEYQDSSNVNKNPTPNFRKNINYLKINYLRVSFFNP